MDEASLWESRELPILRAIAAADATGEDIDTGGVASATGLDPVQVGRGVDALIDAGYVSGSDATSMGDDASVYLDLRLRARGREALGTWDAPPKAAPAAGGQRIIEVLIASPSDTASYRDAVELAIQDWNSQHAIDFGVALLPRRWERDARPALGASPQQVVNDQIVNRSEILIGIFWTRLGTATETADSGTAEEIRRFDDSGRPAHIYFSNQPVIPGSIDTEQYDRLRTFRDQISTRGLIGEFQDEDDLRRQVLADLLLDVRNLATAPRHPESTDNAPAPRLNVSVTKLDSGHEVLLSNVGDTSAAKVRIGLRGGLFLLNAAHERIGDNDSWPSYDEIGTLSPGSSRRYTLISAAQSPPARIIATAEGVDPIEVDVA